MSQATLHILVGIDFSASSRPALLHAKKLATRLRARLHLAHFVKNPGVTTPSDLGFNIPDNFPEAKRARVELQRLLIELGSDVDGQIHLRLGDPARGMLELIKELRPDVVIVCSHGYGPVKRVLLGSVTRQLVEQSPVPVLVVPTPGREAILDEPAPAQEPELPAVGHAVVDSVGGIGLTGIGGVGGGAVVFK